MLSIDPVKIVLVAVVALIVLGPDKLPGALRSLGKMWGDFQRLRSGLETQVRQVVGDLPLPVPGMGASVSGQVTRFVDSLTRPAGAAATTTTGFSATGVEAGGSVSSDAVGGGGGTIASVAQRGAGARGAVSEAQARLRSSQGDSRAWGRPGRLVPYAAELDPGYDDPICN